MSLTETIQANLGLYLVIYFKDSSFGFAENHFLKRSATYQRQPAVSFFAKEKHQMLISGQFTESLPAPNKKRDKTKFPQQVKTPTLMSMDSPNFTSLVSPLDKTTFSVERDISAPVEPRFPDSLLLDRLDIFNTDNAVCLSYHRHNILSMSRRSGDDAVSI